MKFTAQDGNSYYIHEKLAPVLDSLVYNIKKDWDFVILISGDRMVRVGKSVLAQTLGAYLATKLKTEWSLKNIFFDSSNMIEMAAKFPKYSIVVYDEGREGLAANKSMSKLQIDLLDYFAECGQLNHIFIVVLPDFFELKENMAVARSEFLINVYRNEKNIMALNRSTGERMPIVRFERGYFEFFNRRQKAVLYDMSRSTRRKSYKLTKAKFYGRFTNQYTVDEEEYKKKKFQALARFQERKKEQASKAETAKYRKIAVFRDMVLLSLRKKGYTFKEISEIIYHKLDVKISRSHIASMYREAIKKKEEEKKQIEQKS